jgi:4-hydroxythreonine-4-phosphate dehydrogenase
MTAADAPLPLALTMGEPAGIGGEIALKAWLASRRRPVSPFFSIDDPGRLGRIARDLSLDVPIVEIAEPGTAAASFARGLPVLTLPLSESPAPGKPLLATAPSVIASIERAVAFVLAGKAAAVVTNPVHKETLYAAGFQYPGHTEFLAELARRHTGKAVTPVMMLAADELRVVPVTVHIPLREVAASLDVAKISACGRAAVAALVRDFGIPLPRLAVAGLNPHAGEGGTIGTEDRDIVAPAVAELRSAGIAAHGPLAADTLFHEEARKTYDAVLCMYHDQALIPLKTLAFDRGVNVTLGLPFIRTSPDHGTALDIAGSGKARESSLVAAIDLAAAMARRRAAADGRARVA